MYTIILSASMAEAAAHASEQGMSRGQWRWPARANSIAGLRFVDVHELASWKGRRDRHAVEGVLRHARVNARLTFPLEAEEEPEAPKVDLERHTPRKARKAVPAAEPKPAPKPRQRKAPTIEEIGF